MTVMLVTGRAADEDMQLAALNRGHDFYCTRHLVTALDKFDGDLLPCLAVVCQHHKAEGASIEVLQLQSIADTISQVLHGFRGSPPLPTKSGHGPTHW